jgi:hypothetical protein
VGGSCRLHGLQGLEVGVDIGKDESAHEEGEPLFTLHEDWMEFAGNESIPWLRAPNVRG